MCFWLGHRSTAVSAFELLPRVAGIPVDFGAFDRRRVIVCIPPRFAFVGVDRPSGQRYAAPGCIP